MPAWARNLVLIVGMLGWVAMIGVSLWLKQIPGAVLIGYPAGLWLALSGRSKISGNRVSADQSEAVADESETRS